jgi:Domain of unknown function (DUF4381)
MIPQNTVPRCVGRILLILGSLVANSYAQAPEEDIRGPRALVEIPVPEKAPIMLWCAIAVGVLVVVSMVYFLKKRRSKRKQVSPVEKALAALVALEKNPEALAAEVFADHAAGTVRQFIMERLGIVAPRQTTEEFLRALAADEASPLRNEGPQLQQFLSSCDLAKFAGSALTPQQRTGLIQSARAFVAAISHSAQS